MRQPSPQARSGARRPPNKQRTQLMILGGLVGVLGIVLAIQFGGGDEQPALAAGAGEGAAQLAAIGSQQQAAAPSGPDVALAPDNEVLSAQGSGIRANPFAAIWNDDEPEVDEQPQVVVLPPPNVTLSATLTSAKSPVAYIDGRICGLGDQIQGWTLTEIGPREIVLRSPQGRETTIAMPLLTPGG